MSVSMMRGLFVVALLCAGIAAADAITVVRDAPQTAMVGEQIRITIALTNHLDVPLWANVEEQLSLVGDVIEPKPVSEKFDPNVIAARPWRLEWEVSLEPGETKSVYYILRPSIVGDYPLTRTSATAYGKAYFGNPSTIRVVCNSNSVCEPEYGENARTCPQDCASGGSDNVCNRTRDGVCDPDCETKADLDCLDPSTNGSRDRSLWAALPICAGAAVVVGILIAIGYVLFKRKKKEPPAGSSPVLEETLQEPKQPGLPEPEEQPAPAARPRKKLKRRE